MASKKTTAYNMRRRRKIFRVVYFVSILSSSNILSPSCTLIFSGGVTVSRAACGSFTPLSPINIVISLLLSILNS